MPIGSNNPPAARSGGRPPWVRDGPKPIPMPAAPWTLNRRGQQQEEGQASQQPSQAQAAPRKTTQINITPAENGAPKQTTAKLQSREVKVPIVTEKPAMTITTSSTKKAPAEPTPILKHVEPEPKKTEPKVRTQSRPIKDKEEARETIENVIPVKRVHSLVKQDSIKGAPIGPPLCPPMPPPPPPPPPNAPPPEFEKKPITEKQAKRLQMLRSRPRRRPDWTDMMKEVESGRKLKHVTCNDRSGPILSKSMLFKAKGSFVYESEKNNVHNKLLKQIETGVQLKKVKTNDRSKPILDGLRKFRRQMTIEEQIQKSQSQANLSEPPVEEDEVDEMDDIDKVRDDLQSTKQLLALELRNKEAQVRENKRLLARIQNLEAELELERSKVAPTEVKQAGSAPDEALIKSLKSEATAARKTAEDLENKYQKAAEMLDNAKSNLEEQKKQYAILEKKLQQALQGCQRIIQEEVARSKPFNFRQESDTGSKQDSRRPSEAPGGGLAAAEPEEEEEEEQITETESDSDDDEETRKERAAKRLQREIKMLSNKLRTYKDKQAMAKKERKVLKESLKKQQEALKEEKKKYKVLQKEVDKMAALMKDGSDDEDEDEEEPQDEEETESEEESSESEESESESESESEDEDATDEQKRTMLTNRAKRHEGILNALKKGNYLLKANVDRQKDDLNKQREMALTLQEDLNSVLSELG